jgi:anti-sigma regulatory factor (Ser/Thr protein kinase)
VHRDLANDVDAPGAARVAVTQLGDPLGEELAERARLLVSELVTNAFRHGAAGDIQLDVWTDGPALEVTVSDHGRGFDPRGERASAEDPGGWGLMLVDVLSEAWSSGLGTTDAWVWFRLEPRPAL